MSLLSQCEGGALTLVIRPVVSLARTRAVFGDFTCTQRVCSTELRDERGVVSEECVVSRKIKKKRCRVEMSQRGKPNENRRRLRELGGGGGGGCLVHLEQRNTEAPPHFSHAPPEFMLGHRSSCSCCSLLPPIGLSLGLIGAVFHFARHRQLI